MTPGWRSRWRQLCGRPGDKASNVLSFLNPFRDDAVNRTGPAVLQSLTALSELDGRRVAPSEDGQSVTVELPAPKLSEPRLNLETSYVAARDEGLVTRFKGSDMERTAQLEAVERLATAASGEGRLSDLAKASTTATMRGLFGSLGYTDITIIFDESPADGT